jgi:myosin heavy subunit
MRNMKQKMAAIKIQATFKGYYARKCYLQTREAIIKLQAMLVTAFFF